ncbi:MAG: hypothetical protein HKN92_05500 [Chitinophagales bacterium]|nr:hypothetical protein [Chitinophagales bacterium]
MKNLILLIIIASTLHACKHDPIIPIEVPFIPSPVDTTFSNPSTPCDSTIIYFENQIRPLIASNCAIPGCHDALTAEEGVVLNNYDNIMSTADIKAFDPEDSDLYEVLIETDPDKRMPPPSTGNSLTSEQITLIYNWIDQGANNNYCSDSACDTVAMSFTNDIHPIIQQYCIGCHSSGVASGGIIMETHSQLQALAFNGSLFGTINHEAGYVPMPYNQTPLDVCFINKIKSWIDDGAPNN